VESDRRAGFVKRLGGRQSFCGSQTRAPLVAPYRRLLTCPLPLASHVLPIKNRRCNRQTHLPTAKASRAGGAGLSHADVFGSRDCESKVDSTFEDSNYARHRTETEIDTAEFPGLAPGREQRRATSS